MQLAYSTGERLIRRRTRRDPKPRFKPDRSMQLDAVQGAPQLQVPGRHLCRQVLAVCEQIDTSELEARYSSLGRRGYHPRRILAMWIYASLMGIHHASKVARASETDAAFRLLSGGSKVSEATLKRFRAANGAFFLKALARTVEIAQQWGLLQLHEISVDSMRLRAHASFRAVRTQRRSSRRLAELAKIDVKSLSPSERKKHEGQIRKHQQALERCQQLGVSSVVVTNELAGLLKFPHGASAPGHRMTTVASGARERIVLAVLVDASPTDHGKLAPAVEQARAVLCQANVPRALLQVSADAGYWDRETLTYAVEKIDEVDVLVAEAPAPRSAKKEGRFGRELFVFNAEGRLVCPAGNPMDHVNKAPGIEVWKGRGCSPCALKPQCTPAKRRHIEIRTGLDELRDEMRKRLNSDANRRYAKRAPTIEPVFANIEDNMGYRRAASRFEETILAEIYMKVVAHNISRLLSHRPLSYVLCILDVF